MNIIVAAVYGVVAGVVAYIVLILLATAFAPIAQFAYVLALLVGLVVFVSHFAGFPRLK